MKKLTLFLLCLWPALPLLSQAPVFRADVRVVEVYLRVTDRAGAYVDGLKAADFEVLDEGRRQQILAFESGSSEIHCAVLVDTTGSMARALPVVKNAAIHFIDQFRGDDTLAVYAFSDALQPLQDFTSSKEAAKRAIYRTRAVGETALFDAISQVSAEVAERKGKRAIVLFTDGADNASVLSAEAAVTRARKTGVPLYTVAQGSALRDGQLMKMLRRVAQATGASCYETARESGVERLFSDVVRDLQHTYLLLYQPPAAQEQKWRSIQIRIPAHPDYKVLAKEGYEPE